MSAHKLTAGQTIRIHNDWIRGEETHRVLIQVNDGWSMNGKWHGNKYDAGGEFGCPPGVILIRARAHACNDDSRQIQLRFFSVFP
jgi:hypothetical protein